MNKRATMHCSAVCIWFSQWKLLQLWASFVSENVMWVKATFFWGVFDLAVLNAVGFFCEETRNMTESNTLCAPLCFGTGMWQPSMCFFPKCFVHRLALPSDSFSGVRESLPTNLLFGGFKLIHIWLCGEYPEHLWLMLVCCTETADSFNFHTFPLSSSRALD